MTKSNRGRPPFKITPELLKKVQALSANGLTNEQIASVIGVHLATLQKYKNLNNDFNEALKIGKHKGIAKIANALFQKASGGDNAAMIFFLKARAGWSDQPKQYSDDKPAESLNITFTVKDPVGEIKVTKGK